MNADENTERPWLRPLTASASVGRRVLPALDLVAHVEARHAKAEERARLRFERGRLTG